jgi:hypothetical protein
MLPRQTVFICDTYINEDPSAEQLAEIALLAAAEVRRFGLTPRLALLSHSHFGSADTPSARKMRAAAEIIAEAVPDLEVEGEMHADAALSKTLLDQSFPGSRLTDAANPRTVPCRQRAAQGESSEPGCADYAVAQRGLDLECLQESRNVVARRAAARSGADPLAGLVGERLNGRVPHHDEVEWRVVHREHRTHGPELLATGPVDSAVPALQRHAHGKRSRPAHRPLRSA